MGINEDERAWSRPGDGALICHARGEGTADEGPWLGVQQVHCFWSWTRTGLGLTASTCRLRPGAPAGALRHSRQPGGGQQPRTAEHESDSRP